jgi:hypothetical protein
MPAPNKNKNAVGHVPTSKGNKGVTTTLSLEYGLWEQFKAYVDQQKGYSLADEAEYKTLWREYARNGVMLALKGKCSVDGCVVAVGIECSIGECEPGTKYCSYHYQQAHLPEDERD